MNRILKILIAITSAFITPLLVVFVYRLINGVTGAFHISDLLSYFTTKNFFATTKEQFELIALAMDKFADIAFNFDHDYINIQFSGWAEVLQPIGDALDAVGEWFISLAVGVKDVVVSLFNIIVTMLSVLWTFLLDLIDIVGWLFGLFDYALTI